MILTSGRLVEYEGGGDETRSNRWLAELQQEMFVEINPDDAKRLGLKDGGMVWVYGAESNAQGAAAGAWSPTATGQGVVFMPFHFGGCGGRGPARQIPARRRPDRARRGGEPAHDLRLRPVTLMQETKITLCRVEAA